MNFKLVTGIYSSKVEFPASQGEQKEPFPETPENNMRIETYVHDAVGPMPFDLVVRVTVKYWWLDEGQAHDDATEHVQWYENSLIGEGMNIRRRKYQLTQAKQSLDLWTPPGKRLLWGVEAEFRRQPGDLLDKWESYLWRVA